MQEAEWGLEVPLVSVVFPCLNEADNIEPCVSLARSVCEGAGIPAEVIVVDNGSDDGSGELARRAGAIVVSEPRRGYGSAYLAGFDAARGDYIVMVDADLSYDLHEIPRFVAHLDQGAQLVMGNRLESIQPGAMSWLHRVGNPLLTGILNLLVGARLADVHCGMRAIRRDVLPRLELRTTGMEFASEMVIRATKEGLQLAEIPISLHPRGGRSKLSPFRDGWRHLRLILLYSPRHLFLVPGGAMIIAGSAVALVVLTHLTLFGRRWYIHALIGGSLLVMVGVQIISLGLCARVYSVYHLREADPRLERMTRRIRLEHGLLLGALCIFVGVSLGGILLGRWVERGFGKLREEELAIVAGTCVVVGFQIIFTSFLMSILGLRRPDPYLRHPLPESSRTARPRRPSLKASVPAAARTNETRAQPPRAGLRQLATRRAARAAVRRPRWFLLNLRQGFEFLRDRRRESSPPAFSRHIVSESNAASTALGISEATYASLAEQVWVPSGDLDEPLSVWNARDELLRIVAVAVRVLQPTVVVETGVALGFTSGTILHQLEANGCGRLYSIDLPALQWDPDEAIGRAVPEELKHRWELTLGDSRDVLGAIAAGVSPIDIFLHDSLHTYSSQMREYRAVWPYLRSGGLLISDDVGNPAFVEFAEEVRARPLLVTGSSRRSAIGLVQKPATS